MKLYSTATSERGKELGKGGNEHITVKLQRERDRVEYLIEYTLDGLRVSVMTDDGGAVVYEATRKGQA